MYDVWRQARHVLVHCVHQTGQAGCGGAGGNGFAAAGATGGGGAKSGGGGATGGAGTAAGTAGVAAGATGGAAAPGCIAFSSWMMRMTCSIASSTGAAFELEELFPMSAAPLGLCYSRLSRVTATDQTKFWTSKCPKIYPAKKSNTIKLHKQMHVGAQGFLDFAVSTDLHCEEFNHNQDLQANACRSPRLPGLQSDQRSMAAKNSNTIKICKQAHVGARGFLK